MVTRRDLMKGVSGMGLAAALPLSETAQAACPPGTAAPRRLLDPRYTLELPSVGPMPSNANPWFGLGVASGDPTPSSVILWTRLTGGEGLLNNSFLDLLTTEQRACDTPSDGLAGLSDLSFSVGYEVATDAAFANIVKFGSETAHRKLGYSVHVDVTGLQPYTFYYYRFSCNGRYSRVGRTKTLPAANSTTTARFAFISCQDLGAYYGAFQALASENIDFIVHLGDSIYEGAFGSQSFNAVDLPSYRNKHAQFRADQSARDCWARHPFFMMWDNHEVMANNVNYLASGRPRKSAGYQAYYENMPIRASANLPALGVATDPYPATAWADLEIYRSIQFGQVLDMALLSCRQHRNTESGDFAGKSMLSAAQEVPKSNQRDWFMDSFLNAPANPLTWKVIGSPVLMTDNDSNVGWQEYGEERLKILKRLRDTPIRRAIVLSGDVHRVTVSSLPVSNMSNSGNRYAFQYLDLFAKNVGYEFGCMGVASGGHRSTLQEQLCLQYESVNPDLLGSVPNPLRPWIKYSETTYRGYGLCTVTPSYWQTEYKGLNDYLRQPGKPGYGIVTTLAVFRVTQAGNAAPVLTKTQGFVPFAATVGEYVDCTVGHVEEIVEAQTNNLDEILNP